ncbi:MAG: hypothetical protein MZV65_36790 [Chromatiales bacterium]|nr:hypothetical protein [Chromatiales bacterium]
MLAGEPPAVNGDDPSRSANEAPAFTLSASINGCLAEIEELIQFATWPATEDRLGSTHEFLAALDQAEEALEERSRRRYRPLASPLEANTGHELQGFEVIRRLGKGGTSSGRSKCADRTAGQPRQGILKIALEADYNERLKREAGNPRPLAAPPEHRPVSRAP